MKNLNLWNRYFHSKVNYFDFEFMKPQNFRFAVNKWSKSRGFSVKFWPFVSGPKKTSVFEVLYARFARKNFKRESGSKFSQGGFERDSDWFSTYDLRCLFFHKNFENRGFLGPEIKGQNFTELFDHLLTAKRKFWGFINSKSK